LASEKEARVKTLLVSLLACLGSFLSVASAAEACDFDCALMRHLDAIQARDYAAFELTLTRGDRLTFIQVTPRG
jgi:hypothetical protein